MAYAHRPVLLAEVSQHIPCNERTIVVDCTLGGAGHSEAILARIASSGGLLVGIDADIAAIDAARSTTARFSQQILFYNENFRHLDRILADAGLVAVDAVLFDLGVSSPQLDEAERGFSYKHDAPLDMRMAGQGKTAADLVNQATEAQLAQWLWRYGEERFASRVAAAIVAERPIQTTGELARIVKDAIPAATRRSGGHPARRTFQALRIVVNDELSALEEGLDAAVKWLKPGGVLLAISYHSLEDRLVKTVMREAAQGCVCPPDMAVCVCGNQPILELVTRRPIRPTPEEVSENPRARSAKLRIARKVST
jgi:16S rRNA (cytosine1402-N4)-methyltransferase